jgi:hypothetical protein
MKQTSNKGAKMDKQVMQDIEASGLFSVTNEEPYFSWGGCEHPDCTEKGKGATVYDVKGYRSLAEAQNGNDNYYEFQVCGDCLYRMEYGE